VYTTIRGGAGHLPVFKCIVEVAGRVFVGDPAKSKKQAEKNAAMSAWSAIKKRMLFLLLLLFLFLFLSFSVSSMPSAH
jgi:dsRNA-specific ribonuclease